MLGRCRLHRRLCLASLGLLARDSLDIERGGPCFAGPSADPPLRGRLEATIGDQPEPRRIFLLSPANCGGRRAQMVLAPDARFDLAVRLRSAAGVPLGELFAFVSGLYFRGKLKYATRFAAPPGEPGPMAGAVHIITPIAGLQRPSLAVTADTIRTFAASDIDAENPLYRRPLEESARALREDVGPCQVVLLGSIASPKYVDILLGIFGEQLCFPSAFVGRGDMSRGGLLLRQVEAGEELEYIQVRGAVRHGARPPRLERRPSNRADRSTGSATLAKAGARRQD